MGPHRLWTSSSSPATQTPALSLPALTCCSWITPHPSGLSRVPPLHPCLPTLPRWVKCSLFEFSYYMCFSSIILLITSPCNMHLSSSWNILPRAENLYVKWCCSDLEDFQTDTFLRMWLERCDMYTSVKYRLGHGSLTPALWHGPPIVMSSNAIEDSQQIGWVLKNHKATWFPYQNHSSSCVNTGDCTTQLTFL